MPELETREKNVFIVQLDFICIYIIKILLKSINIPNINNVRVGINLIILYRLT